jgi:hypothetical protein
MGDVVNLRMARKRQARADKAADAAANRARHGRTGAQKQRDRLQGEALTRHLDGHRLKAAETESGES